MTNFMELPPGRDIPNIVNAVIEIPKGSSNKYEYDKQYNIFRLDRTLYSPVHYPGAYGFIPQTHAEDGDPLDVVVIVENATFTGCLIEVRPLGVLIMRDDAGLDHKILAVPINDPRMREVHGLQHLPSHYLAEVDYFFNIYKDLEGKKSDTYGWEDRVVAHQVIRECIQRYHDLKTGRPPAAAKSTRLVPGAAVAQKRRAAKPAKAAEAARTGKATKPAKKAQSPGNQPEASAEVKKRQPGPGGNS